MTATLDSTVAFDAVKSHIQAALERGGDTYSLEDIRLGIVAGAFQLWSGEDCAVVTQLHVFPRKTLLCLLLAGGRLEELKRLLPIMLGWGKAQGCQGAYLVGRTGWLRSFLLKEQWRPSAVVLELDFSGPDGPSEEGGL